METGTIILESMLSELDEMGLSTMAQTLSRLYHAPSFLETDRLSLFREVIDAEYQSKSGKKFTTRLKEANLSGCPASVENCVDSKDREYLPEEITVTLASLDFIERGLNICILGPSDSGKSYLAKALAIQACHNSSLFCYKSIPLICLPTAAAVCSQHFFALSLHPESLRRKSDKECSESLPGSDEQTRGWALRCT